MASSRTTRGIVMTSCAGLALSWVCAGSAQAATGTAFTVGGPTVTPGSSANEAPSVGPGAYSTTMPVSGGTRYWKVKRKAGERLQVGFVGQLTWANGAWVSKNDSSQNFTFTLETSDGTQCQTRFTPVPGGSHAGALLNAYLYTDPSSDARTRDGNEDNETCRKATDFHVTLKRDVVGSDAQPMKLQMSVVTAPATKDTIDTPSSDSIAPMDTSALAPSREITPGTGIFDAPALEPKGYTIEAKPGKIMVVKVHLAPGQRLSAGWQFPANGSSPKLAQDLTLGGQISSPGLANVMLGDDGKTKTTVTTSTSGSSEFSMYTAPVNFGNANLAVTNNTNKNAWFQTDPGWYYVFLRASPSDESGKKDGLKDAQPVKTTLSLRVQGQAADGPSMDVAQPKGEAISGPPGQSSMSTALWGSAFVLGLAGAVALGVFMRQRAKKQRAAQGR